jgi:hypothetical protein
VTNVVTDGTFPRFSDDAPGLICSNTSFEQSYSVIS